MAGWKEWAIGEIVEAGDIQGFIQNQTVMVFDTDTARDTALSGVVIEGMMAYTKDSNLVKVYDGAAWIGLAEAPDLSTLIPKSTVTTAGDLIVADGASSVTRLGVGADDQVLTLASGAPVWADAGGGGGYNSVTDITSSNSSYSVSAISGFARFTIIGGGGGGGAGYGSASGGATTLTIAGTTYTAGRGLDGGVASGRDTEYAYVSGNGGGNQSSASASRAIGQGGQVIVKYHDLTGVSTMNVAIGAGGSGSGDGHAGIVIMEYAV